MRDEDYKIVLATRKRDREAVDERIRGLVEESRGKGLEFFFRKMKGLNVEERRRMERTPVLG